MEESVQSHVNPSHASVTEENEERSSNRQLESSPLQNEKKEETLTTPMTSIGDRLRVLVESSLRHLEGRRDPLRSSPRQLLVRNVHVERVLDGVDGDDVSVSNESDGTSNLGLRNDVTDLGEEAKKRRESEARSRRERGRVDSRRNHEICEEKRRKRRQHSSRDVK